MKEQQQDKERQEVHTGEKPAALSWVTCYGVLIDGTTIVQGERKSDQSVRLFTGLKDHSQGNTTWTQRAEIRDIRMSLCLPRGRQVGHEGGVVTMGHLVTSSESNRCLTL